MARVAIVTGGTRGIGRAISIALRDQDYRVAAVYRSNVESAREFSTSTSIPSYQWDTSDFLACQQGVRDIENELGPVDILVNNAGIVADATLHRMKPEQWSRVINTNLGSVFNMSRNVIEGMRERSYGRIVNISSVNGQKGQFGQANYAAAKGGILAFTKALALEGARRNVTVNAVAPGYCDTEMLAAIPQDVMASIIESIPVGRLGTAADIARAVVFLADERSGFITGATFSVNGGQFMI